MFQMWCNLETGNLLLLRYLSFLLDPQNHLDWKLPELLYRFPNFALG